MNDTTTALDSVGIADILKALPHRYPFLMVDRICSIRGDDFAIGVKNVTANEPQFLGHFPGNPVFPGVLMIEGMAQTAGVICIRAVAAAETKLVYFMTIDKAKFRKPVVPGDTIEYHVTKLVRKRNIWWYRAEAKVAGELVAEAEIGAMIADAGKPQ
jgi:3-hydroxyacyl-[acyl-carrier-protein] dehydratase